MDNQFMKRIQTYLPDEYDVFINTLSNEMYRGLRVNPQKITDEDFQNDVGFSMRKTLFCQHGYYVDQALGLHPYHVSGLFYLQEPSASSPVEVLDVQEDDVVLDLCAAPGGKSTQIAANLKSGFLVANETDAKRAQVLLSNMERMGVSDMIVSNSKPERLCSAFASCFDKVLVDAPCSGEGMMKKHNEVLQDWSLKRIEACAARQKGILTAAYQALKKDGILVYSTCTYAKEENEDVITWFLENYPDMELIPIDVTWGRPAFGMPARRIFPMDKGEGHFLCKLKKTRGTCRKLPTVKKQNMNINAKTFVLDQLGFLPAYAYMDMNEVYGMNHPFIRTKGLHILRQGVYLGKCVKNRFEPGHSFYMVADWLQAYKNKVNLNREQMDDFMHGLEIEYPFKKGYVAVCVNGYPFGFGKSDGNKIKNKIPKGLRLRSSSHIMEL